MHRLAKGKGEMSRGDEAKRDEVRQQERKAKDKVRNTLLLGLKFYNKNSYNGSIGWVQ